MARSVSGFISSTSFFSMASSARAFAGLKPVIWARDIAGKITTKTKVNKTLITFKMSS
jgi:hypothetical protein